MCVKKIVCLAMCVKKIDCRQPADLYIKKTAKKIKRRPKLLLAPLGQQFHLIGILYILPRKTKYNFPGKKKFVSATSGKKLFAFDQREKK